MGYFWLLSRDLEKNIYSPTAEEINQITTFSKNSGISESVLLAYYVNHMIQHKSMYGTPKQVTSCADVAVSCYYQDRARRYSCVDLIAKVFALFPSNLGFSEAVYRWRKAAKSHPLPQSYVGTRPNE